MSGGEILCMTQVIGRLSGSQLRRNNVLSSKSDTAAKESPMRLEHPAVGLQCSEITLAGFHEVWHTIGNLAPLLAI